MVKQPIKTARLTEMGSDFLKKYTEELGLLLLGEQSDPAKAKEMDTVAVESPVVMLGLKKEEEVDEKQEGGAKREQRVSAPYF